MDRKIEDAYGFYLAVFGIGQIAKNMVPKKMLDVFVMGGFEEKAGAFGCLLF